MKKWFILILCLIALSAHAEQRRVLSMFISSATANGTIGELTHDTSSTCYPGNYYHDKFQPIVAGKINYAHIYIANGNGDTICLSVHSSDGAELAHCSGDPGTDDAGWFTCQLDTEVTLVTVTDYYLNLINEGGHVTLYRDNNGDGAFYDADASPTCGAAIPSPEAAAYNAGDNISLYADNNAGDPN